MAFQPEPYTPPDQNSSQVSGGQPMPVPGRSIPTTNPYMKYTLLDAIVGFLGALVVLYTQLLGGTFFIFLCALIAFYRGIRALIFANRHGTAGRATGISAIVLGGLSLLIMIYLFITVGVH